MRLKILASAVALSPVLLLVAASASAFQICDSNGKCVSGTAGAEAAPAAAPLQPLVIAPPADAPPPAPIVVAPPPAPVVIAPPPPALAPVVVAPPAPVVVPPPTPLPPVPVVELTPVPMPAAEPAPAAMAGAHSVSVETESGPVTVITQTAAPATTNASRLPASALPPKGMSRAAVSSQFGQPHTRHAPVGGGSPRQPPITRWDYAGFSVFFEYDHVVDAVERNNPAPIAVRDGLAGGPRP